MIEIHLAVQVVDLVLHAGRPEPDEIAFLDLARLVQEAHGDGARAADRGMHTGQVGAGFVMLAQLHAGMQDLGVGHAQRLAPLLAGIDHRQTLHHADLHRRKADTRHCLHRVDHVDPGGADVIGDFSHRFGGRLQPLVGPWQAFADRHFSASR